MARRARLIVKSLREFREPREEPEGGGGEKSSKAFLTLFALLGLILEGHEASLKARSLS